MCDCIHIEWTVGAQEIKEVILYSHGHLHSAHSTGQQKHWTKNRWHELAISQAHYNCQYFRYNAQFAAKKDNFSCIDETRLKK